MFFRLSLALLAHAETSLLGKPLDEVADILRSFPPPLHEGLEAQHIVPMAWTMKVTHSNLSCMLACAEEALRDSELDQSVTAGATADDAQKDVFGLPVHK